MEPLVRLVLGYFSQLECWVVRRMAFLLFLPWSRVHRRQPSGRPSVFIGGRSKIRLRLG